MNKKILKVFTSLFLLTLVISGCEKTNNSSSSSNDVSSNPTGSVSDELSSNADSSSSMNSSSPSSDSSSMNSSSDSSSELPVVEYSIYVASSGNAKVVLNTNKAAPGDVVTLEIIPEDGYRVDRVVMNNNELSSYSFVMPNSSAIITVYTTLIDKDGYIIDGDISAKLVEEENGLYVARNVRVEADSNVYYSLGGSEPLNITKIDNNKSFANISYSNSGNGGFKIAGNAVYDFYYDSKNLATPCYIQRVDVINLPNTEASFASLFAGEAKSDSTVYPAGVNKVEYTSVSKNEKYVWELYSDNSSYAQVINPVTGKEKAIVYKAQDDNVYRVVDNYLEGSSEGTYITRSDTTAFSGQYDIVNAVSQKSYQRLQSDVDVDANLYSHTMESLDAEFYQAYRNGYVGNIYNDVTVDHDASVISEELDKGDFKVSLNTWVRWNDSAYYQESTGYKSAYVTYEMDVTFTKAGAIKTGTFIETFYGENYYDFSSNQFKTGYESVEPKREVSFTYSYGDAKAGQPDVDVSKYFTQEITNIVVQGKNSTETDTLGISEDLKASVSSAATTSHNMTFVCNPSTALDTWQYGPVASSNTSVIAPKSVSTPYDFRAMASGSSEITIGNHTVNANSVTAKKLVYVDTVAFIRSIFMYTSYPYPSYDDTFFANYGYVESGKTYEIQVAGSTTAGNYVYNGLGLKFTNTTNNEDLISIAYDDATGKILIDASNAKVTEQTTVCYTVECPVQLSDWPSATFTYYVLPSTDYDDSIVGTWNNENDNSYIRITSETNGTIYVANGSNTLTFDFTYTYDSSSGKITASVPYADNTYYTLKMYIDSSDGALCVYFCSEKMGSSWDDVTLTEYFGMNYGDEYGDDFRYEGFIKA